MRSVAPVVVIQGACEPRGGASDHVRMARLVNYSRGMSETARTVKSDVEGDVNAEIAAHARQPPAAARRIAQVAGTFRDHAVDEVVDSERAVRRSRAIARVSQFVDYAFFVIYTLLAIRFVLVLIAARSTSGFVQFIVSVTNPFYAPFKNIVASEQAGAHTLMVPLLVALGAYVILHIAINRLLRLVAIRRTEL